MQARRRLRIANKRKTSLADLEPGDIGGKAGRSSTGKKVVIASDLLLTFVPIRGPIGLMGRIGPIFCDRFYGIDGIDLDNGPKLVGTASFELHPTIGTIPFPSLVKGEELKVTFVTPSLLLLTA